jgi:hypothetical protein
MATVPRPLSSDVESAISGHAAATKDSSVAMIKCTRGKEEKWSGSQTLDEAMGVN